MRDLNFFEPYIDKREFKLDRKLFLYALLMFGILSLIGFGVYNQIQIYNLNKTVTSLRSIAEDPKTLERVEAIKVKEEELNTFREEVTKIKELDETISCGDIIDEDLLILITSKMPEDLFFTSFSAYNREIQISGISKDKYSIAELSRGLDSIEYVEEVFVSNISSESDYNKFNLNIILKDVVENGED